MVGGTGFGSVGSYIKSMLAGWSLANSRNWLALRGAVSWKPERPQMSKHWNKKAYLIQVDTVALLYRWQS